MVYKSHSKMLDITPSVSRTAQHIENHVFALWPEPSELLSYRIDKPEIMLSGQVVALPTLTEPD